MKTYKFIKGSGAYNKYTLVAQDGSTEEFSFLASNLPKLFEERPELKESMYNNLCEIMIMTYQSNGQIQMDDETELDEREDGGME